VLPLLVGQFDGRLEETRKSNMVVYVRYVELAVELSTKSEVLCLGLAKPILHKVFADFFDMMDLLS